MADALKISGDNALTLLEMLPSWGNTTTIVIHGGCVFEYKGDFPQGSLAHGFYNLGNGGKGFEGHLKLENISTITLQAKQHRGRDSYAFVFETVDSETLFKVFLGRDSSGELLAHQVQAFKTIQANVEANHLFNQGITL